MIPPVSAKDPCEPLRSIAAVPFTSNALVRLFSCTVS